ncbi:ABC transporter permease subunit [Echinimonas agarilytica]|uniref:ABC transporter permease subunit n=1 Tax=Echinimonas agarilytica TaxID=1215918 RepID=A0AA42B7W8_9GAMM|nr:ABC transporter permease subunit [Echinimonas agarilytica]MCM2680184.1 ABC transporter permease subunit [Echinimonas agarilytica]
MWYLYLKELLELTRDRRVMMTMVLTPIVFMPMIMALAGGVAAAVAVKEHQKTLNYALVGDKSTYDIVAAFNRQTDIAAVSLPPGMTARQALEAQRVDFVLEISGELPHASWTLHHNAAKAFSRAQNIVKRVQRELVSQWHNQQLELQGLSEAQRQEWLKPIALNDISIADERETVGAGIGGMLPYMMLYIALVGAMYPAIDVGAGEKERGTLETLLMAPMSTEKMVTAKVMVVSTSAFVAGALTLLSLGSWASVAVYVLDVEFIQKAIASFRVTDLFMMLLLIVPVSFIFGAMMTAISFYARSFKEAQNYMGLTFTVVFLPLLVASIPGIELDWFWALVPLSNVVLAIKELAKGTLDWGYLIVILLNAAIVAWALISMTVRWCRRESVLFR